MYIHKLAQNFRRNACTVAIKQQKCNTHHTHNYQPPGKLTRMLYIDGMCSIHVQHTCVRCRGKNVPHWRCIVGATLLLPCTCMLCGMAYNHVHAQCRAIMRQTGIATHASRTTRGLPGGLALTNASDAHSRRHCASHLSQAQTHFEPNSISQSN